MVAAALRETEEELALPQDHVEILGSLPPEYSLGNKSRVWPVIVRIPTCLYLLTSRALSTAKTQLKQR